MVYESDPDPDGDDTPDTAVVSYNATSIAKSVDKFFCFYLLNK